MTNSSSHYDRYWGLERHQFSLQFCLCVVASHYVFIAVVRIDYVNSGVVATEEQVERLHQGLLPPSLPPSSLPSPPLPPLPSPPLLFPSLYGER
jgi:hypothetical protein